MSNHRPRQMIIAREPASAAFTSTELGLQMERTKISAVRRLFFVLKNFLSLQQGDVYLSPILFVF